MSTTILYSPDHFETRHTATYTGHSIESYELLPTEHSTRIAVPPYNQTSTMKTTTAATLVLLNALTVNASPLSKRETSEYLIPKPVIVLLIRLGSGLLVCMGFAVHSTFGFKQDGNDPKGMSPEQMKYMTEVRVRNMDRLMAEGARHYKGPMRVGEVVYD